MLSRSQTTTTALTGRASAMRRLRRRAAASQRAYCATNGCTTFLEVDPATGVPTCPICGYARRSH